MIFNNRTIGLGETLGNTTTLTAELRGNAVPDAVIIAQQSSNIYKVYVGLADGTLIDTVVGGMVFIASPTTPLAIVGGEGISMDYIITDDIPAPEYTEYFDEKGVGLDIALSHPCTA